MSYSHTHRLNAASFRSLLFVPGNKPAMFAKALNSGADAVIFDLEDSVPETEKEYAREEVRRSLQTSDHLRPAVFIRANDHSHECWKSDLESAVGLGVAGVVLPKCESEKAVRSAAQVISAKEGAKHPKDRVWLLLLIETARGLLNAAALASSSSRVQALVFGSEDFCTDMEVENANSAELLVFARAFLSVSARSVRCIAIDTVYSKIRDLRGLKRDAALAWRLGFTGKLAIHPTQVSVINRAFSATEKELRNASRLVSLGDDAGVQKLGSMMVDKPVVERARRLLKRSMMH